MQYRREIDGLRALAVVPVILFHGGFEAFGGGFIGVDVFFVISGYLITTIILAELEKGSFSILRFYERRARRILPALFLVMACCLPFAWLWLLPKDLAEFSRSMAAVAVFLSNVLFWRESGYFDTAAELKPLLHTWSLAVEEQYYVLFPLFLLLAWRMGRRALVAGIALVAVASLAAADRFALTSPAATFFLLPTRLWELAIGALCAFWLARESVAPERAVWREALAVAGVVLVGASVLLFDEATPFPSVYALVPTVGTALLILYARPNTAVGKALGTPLLVGIGLISYSAYLWHQPLFSFARHRSFVEPSSTLMAVLAVATLGLAWMSWRFVEQPFRRAGTIGRNTVFGFALVGSALFIALGAFGYLRGGFPERIPNYDQIAQDFRRHDLRADCDRRSRGGAGELEVCALGFAGAPPAGAIGVFGDSHSIALLPAFDEAGKSARLVVWHLGVGGCPPLLGADVLLGNWEPGACERLAARYVEIARDKGLKEVFLVARWSLYTDGARPGKAKKDNFLVDAKHRVLTMQNSREVFTAAVERTIGAYSRIGTTVHFVEQAPQQRTQPERLFQELNRRGLTGSPTAAQIVTEQSVGLLENARYQDFSRRTIRAAARAAGQPVIALDGLFCDDRRCPIGDANHSLYRDEDHLNLRGVARLTATIRRAL